MSTKRHEVLHGANLIRAQMDKKRFYPVRGIIRSLSKRWWALPRAGRNERDVEQELQNINWRTVLTHDAHRQIAESCHGLELPNLFGYEASFERPRLVQRRFR